MRTVIKLSVNTISRNKRNATIITLIIIMSSMLITTIFSVCVALLDLQDNILYDEFLSNDRIPSEEILGRVRSNDERLAIRNIGIVFTCVGVFIATFSISNAVQINYGEKVKTLSALSMLGCETKHKFVLLVFDTIAISAVAVPLGIIAGIFIVDLMINHLNTSVCAVLGLPNIILLRGKIFGTIILLAVLNFATAFFFGSFACIKVD